MKTIGSRLKAGGKARTLVKDINVRSSPKAVDKTNIITQFDSNIEMTIVAGPTYDKRNNIYWWNIESDDQKVKAFLQKDKNNKAWIAECFADEYYLGPVTHVAPKTIVHSLVPDPPVVPSPIVQPTVIKPSVNSKSVGRKMWCFLPTTAYSAVGGTQMLDIPQNPFSQGVVVELTGNQASVNHDLWLEVTYTYNVKEKNKWDTKTTPPGWVNAIFLDDYNEQFPEPILEIPNQTPDPNDAQQYMAVDGRDRYNLCGEFCATYIVHKDRNSEATILSVLKDWMEAKGSSYSKVLGGDRDFGVDVTQLKNLLRNYYNADEIADLTTAVPEHSLVPAAMKTMLKNYYLIARVKSNVKGSGSGELKPATDPDERNHWVVVERLSRNGDGVVLYNPFTNKLEEYSYLEFFYSCTGPSLSGVWVKRESSMEQKEAKIEVPKRVKVHIDQEKKSEYTANQYIDINNQKKTELCGQFSVAYILSNSVDTTLANLKGSEIRDAIPTLLKAYGYYRDVKSFSIECVLDYWKETEEKLYNDTVGENLGTGIDQLKTILQSYGYNNSEDIINFVDGLSHNVSGSKENTIYLPSPGNMKKMLDDQYLIAGVLISKDSGKLVNRTGINKIDKKTKKKINTLHWVVVESIEPTGKHYTQGNKGGFHKGGSGGWVTLYNPFTNTWEGYSYLEYIYSLMFEDGTGVDGLWVKRKITPKFVKKDGGSAQGRVGGRSGVPHHHVDDFKNHESLSTELSSPLSDGELITHKVSNTIRSMLI